MPVNKETTLDECWKDFEERCIPPVATAQQRRAMRDSFFFGAHALYTVIGAYQREVNETKPDEAGFKAMAETFSNRLANEFHAFFDDTANDGQH